MGIKFNKKNIKKSAAVILTAALILSLFQIPVLAQANHETSDNAVNVLNDVSGSVQEGWTLDSDGVLTIEADGAISLRAFEENNNIKKVVIKGGITSIGNYAFYYCENLTSVTISSDSKVSSIGNFAFEGCDKLESITVPSTVTSIGNNAFRYCTSLTSIEIPSSVTSIGSNAFGGCTNLTIKGSTNSVAETYAKSNKINFETNGTKVDPVDPGQSDNEGTFSDNLKWSLDENGVLTISGTGDMVFNNDEDIIPWWEDDISEVKSVVIKNGVTSIGIDAFSNCDNLESVEIAASVTSIDEEAFKGCESLSKITFASESKLKTIGNKVFYDCDDLESIIMPTSVESIGDSAFAGCDNLKSVELSDNLISIGASAFKDCGKLAGLEFPEGLTTIDASAFCGCNALTSITIPASVTSIGASAFKDCSNISSFEFAEDSELESIGEEALANCGKLKSITIPTSVTTIGENALGKTCTYDDTDEETDEWEVVEGGFTISSTKEVNSAAYKYASANKINFIEIHVLIKKEATEATCTEQGNIENYQCKNCGLHFKDAYATQEIVDKGWLIPAGHKLEKVDVQPASLTKSGNATAYWKCTACGKLFSDENGKNEITETTPIAKIATVELSKSSSVYTGKAQTPSVTVKDTDGKALTQGTDYAVSGSFTKAGSYKVTVTFKGNYTGSKQLPYTITKASQSLTVKCAAKTVSYTKVKKAKQTAVPITKVTGAKTTLSYKISKYVTSKAKKYLTVNAKTGKVTVKKKTPKGTYKIQVKVSAATDNNYKAASKTVTLTIKVK